MTSHLAYYARSCLLTGMAKGMLRHLVFMACRTFAKVLVACESFLQVVVAHESFQKILVASQTFAEKKTR
jgi:hypothetical protein